MSQTARAVISKMSDQYPELLEHGELILRLTDYEEGRFLQTLHEASGIFGRDISVQTLQSRHVRKSGGEPSTKSRCHRNLA